MPVLLFAILVSREPWVHDRRDFDFSTATRNYEREASCRLRVQAPCKSSRERAVVSDASTTTSHLHCDDCVDATVCAWASVSSNSRILAVRRRVVRVFAVDDVGGAVLECGSSESLRRLQSCFGVASPGHSLLHHSPRVPSCCHCARCRRCGSVALLRQMR